MTCAYCGHPEARKHRRGWRLNSGSNGKHSDREKVWVCDACAEELDWQ